MSRRNSKTSVKGKQIAFIEKLYFIRSRISSNKARAFTDFETTECVSTTVNSLPHGLRRVIRSRLDDQRV